MTDNRHLAAFATGGQGELITRSPVEAMESIHLLLNRAARERLNVYILCASLSERIRDNYYKTVTGERFGESIRRVLQATANVSILLWGDPATDGIAPSIKSLLREARRSPDWGKLVIRSTGDMRDEGQPPSDELSHLAPHFIVACDRTRSTWLVRLEQRHKPLGKRELDNDTTLHPVPAVVYFGVPTAAKYGAELLDMFHTLFEAAGSRAAGHRPEGYFAVSG